MGRLLIGLSLWFAFVSSAMAQSHTVLIDRSGSVRAYYENGRMDALSEAVLASIKEGRPRQLLAFGTDVVPVPNLHAIQAVPFGRDTYLDRAMERAIRDRQAIVWMITDNVMDRPEDSSAGNTRAFYQLLQRPSVNEVIILPFRQPRGLSGIVVYAILLSPDAEAELDQEVEEFRRQSAGAGLQTVPLRMKPLDRGNVKLIVRGGKDVPVFEEGNDIQTVVDIGFRSKMDHLKIVNAGVVPQPTKPEFDDPSLLLPEQRQVAVKPNLIRVLDPNGETGETYRVQIDFGRVKLKRNLASIFRAAWGGRSSEEISLNLPFQLVVPQQNFQFRQDLLQNYHASTPEMAKATGKIYGIESLPVLLSDVPVRIPLQVPVKIRVNYPKWPAFVSLGILLLLLAGILSLIVALAVAARRLRRSHNWQVTAASDAGTVLPAVQDHERRIFLNGDQIGTIRSDEFAPSENVTVIDGGGRRLEDGAVMNVNVGRRRVRLEFHQAAEGTATSGLGDGRAPRRRD